MSRSDALSEAIKLTDLPALIVDMFPDSRAQPGKQGTYYASWRDNTSTPALSIYKHEGTWMWSDKATGEGGNAFHFLVGPGKMERQAAAEFLLSHARISRKPPPGSSKGPRYTPIPKAAFSKLSAREPALNKAMAGRGFNKKTLDAYGIKADGDDALIPITNPEGVVIQVKRRLGVVPAKGGKYKYDHPGQGAPPWCSIGSREAPLLYIIEGELSAIIAHASLSEAGEQGFGVMGVSGAQQKLYEDLCLGKQVFIYADDDEAGQEAVLAWSTQARDEGARSVHVMPAQSMDFCDYAGRFKRPALAELLDNLRRQARQVYGPLDRMVGEYSVRSLIESAARYISGGVMHSTGFLKVDKETGGIREGGVYSIGALSGMGKSALMRRFLIEHVRSGGKVRLYSPDQSAVSNYRLLASLLSDVGLREMRLGEFEAATLKRYETVDAARAAWKKAYEFVVTELSQRYQIVDENRINKIAEDVPRAIDQGVTMFGLDYIQIFEPDSGDEDARRDGLAVRQIQKLAMNYNKPFLAAMQLKKSAFGKQRPDGTPYVSDIEGAGAYFQASEMIFMPYNDHLYSRKYGNGEVDSARSIDDAQLFLRKDKEGDGDVEFDILWVPRLAAFKDYGKLDVEHERRGLME